MTKRLLVYSFALMVFCYAIYSIFRITSSLAPDFSVFYDAARGLLAHQNIYTLSLYTGLGYPPFTLMPFLPFTLFPYPLAQSIWIYLSFLLFLGSIYLSLALFRKKVTFIGFCTVFIFAFIAFPSKFTLGMGQVNFMALTLLLFSLWLINRKKFSWSGIAFGLLCIIKPHFLLFVPLYMLAGQWMVLTGAFVAFVAGIVATGLLFGWDLYLYYFGVTVPPLLVFAGRGIYYNQGLGSFLSRIIPNPPAGDLTLWTSLLLVVCALWFVWHRRLSFTRSVILFIPVFLLVEPLSWQHHYVFLLPVYIWLTTRMKNNMLWAAVVLSYILVAINFRNPPAFALSHVFLGNILLLYLVIHENT